MLSLISIDPLLGLVGGIGLGASVGTALIVDLARDSGRTLGDVMVDGPAASELSPGHAGLALIGGGGVGPAEAREIISRFASRWPAVVVVGAGFGFPTVPFNLLYPGRLAPRADALPGVWQPVRGSGDPPAPGPVLPLLRPSLLAKLMNGHLPRRSAWIRAWRPVWELPWG